MGYQEKEGADRFFILKGNDAEKPHALNGGGRNIDCPQENYFSTKKR